MFVEKTWKEQKQSQGVFVFKQVQIRNKKIGFKMKHSIYKMYNPISDISMIISIGNS